MALVERMTKQCGLFRCVLESVAYHLTMRMVFGVSPGLLSLWPCAGGFTATFYNEIHLFDRPVHTLLIMVRPGIQPAMRPVHTLLIMVRPGIEPATSRV